MSPFLCPKVQKYEYIRPNAEIIEQPAHRVRFRYSCEGQHSGSIRGVERTYPKIRINGCNGLATTVVVSCVTKDPPYRVHPQGLYGPGTRDGLLVGRPTLNNEFELERIGIQRVKYSLVDQALQSRAQARVPELAMFHSELRIDPFGHGFEHAKDITREDLCVVRLAFQVFVQNRDGTWEVLTPVVSEPIIDASSASNSIQIRWVSDSSGTFAGGETVAIALHEKVKPNTEVVFYELGDANECKWQCRANILAVHSHTIVFQTPPYNMMSDQNINALFMVRRLSDNHCSKPCSFQYTQKRQRGTPQEMQPHQEPRGLSNSQEMPMEEDLESGTAFSDALALLSIYPSGSSNF